MWIHAGRADQIPVSGDYVRTDNASLTFFRQRIAYLLSLRTDSAWLVPVVEKDALRGTWALVLPPSPRRLRRRADAGGPTESPANPREKLAPRGMTTARSSTLGRCFRCAERDRTATNPRCKVADRADIPVGDAVAEERPSRS